MKLKLLIAIAALIAASQSIGAPVELECVRETDEGDKFRGVIMNPETEDIQYAKVRGKFKDCSKVKITDETISCNIGMGSDAYFYSMSIDRYAGVLTEKSNNIFYTREYSYDCSVVERTEKKF